MNRGTMIVLKDQRSDRFRKGPGHAWRPDTGGRGRAAHLHTEIEASQPRKAALRPAPTGSLLGCDPLDLRRHTVTEFPPTLRELNADLFEAITRARVDAADKRVPGSMIRELDATRVAVGDC